MIDCQLGFYQDLSFVKRSRDDSSVILMSSWYSATVLSAPQVCAHCDFAELRRPKEAVWQQGLRHVLAVFVAALKRALKFKEEAGILPLYAHCACDFNSISKRAEVQRRSRNPAIACALRV
ncbi:hypothetical protein NDU88_006236 [Pleurodeles waltl]|uniref:Uncharacterized protein n=1 Tax=Pleurodeles waltl TaxID=8319 RepID=A0AAV7WX22_PLEWA|nr:hypothetical protein NDU88_006236 [Pleurodeles waltl]